MITFSVWTNDQSIMLASRQLTCQLIWRSHETDDCWHLWAQFVFTWLLPQASLRLTLKARVHSHNSSSSLITTRTARCTTTWSWPRWIRRCYCGWHTRQHAAFVTFTLKSMAHKVNLPLPTETWRARTSWSRRMERVALLTSASPSSSTGAYRCDYSNSHGREKVICRWYSDVLTAGRGEEPREDLSCTGEKLKLTEAR